MPAARSYLDHNASAPLMVEARDAVLAAMDIAGNPSSVHREGQAQRRMVEKARRAVAKLVHAKPDQVVFTSGATEAAATLLTPHYVMGRAGLTIDHLFVAASDHPCTLAGGQFAQSAITELPVNTDGILEPETLAEALQNHQGRALVCFHFANNETGIIQPVRALVKMAKAAGAITIIDAVQAVGRLPVDLSQLDADFILLSAHKIGGPKGVGAFVAASDVLRPKPLIVGGGQEHGHRSGTEAVPLIAGFGAAAEVACENQIDYSALRDHFESSLKALDADIHIHGANAPRLSNTSFFSLLGVKAETAQIAFDLAGLAVSSGSACSSGKTGQSHVLKAMGVESDDGAVRISFGPNNDESDVERALNVCAHLINRREEKRRVA